MPDTAPTDTTPTHEVVARALYDADCVTSAHPGFDQLGESSRQNYLDMARAAIAAMRRGDDLPDPDEIGDDTLDEDRVARIAWAYDPLGTLYADVHRLARSHENLRRRLPIGDAVKPETLGEILWLIAHLADNARPDVMVPARLAHLVEGARAVYQPGRYTLAVPLDDCAPTP